MADEATIRVVAELLSDSLATDVHEYSRDIAHIIRTSETSASRAATWLVENGVESLRAFETGDGFGLSPYDHRVIIESFRRIKNR